MRLQAVVALAMSALLLGACGDEAPPPKPSATKPAAAPAPTVAAKPSAWPFVGEGAESAGAEPSMTKNYYVVFDASGSMTESKCSGNEAKLAVAKRALLSFAGNVPKDANLGLQVFDGGGIREVQPLSRLDSGRFQQLVANIRAGGGTPLRDSLGAAYRALTAQARRQLAYGEYHLVMITDGEANSGQDPLEAVNRLLSESPVVLHTIGFCLGDQHSLNQPGRVLYRAADNPQELQQKLSDVLAEAPVFDVTGFK